jgi:hypothetical protein
MTESRTGNDLLQSRANARRLAAGLLHPSTLLLLAANALPILGVLYWGWDVFVLLILYWMETAIIGFWMIVRIAIAPPGALGKIEINGRPTQAGALFVAGFFMVHAGIFMGVHMVFLWALFSGEWSRKIHGLVDFFGTLVIATDMWIPLLALFAVRGLSFLFHALRPELIESIERNFNLPVAPRPAAPEELGSIVGGFYSRVVIMHMTIIFSAFVAVIFGTIAPLIIMVLVKTVADVSLHLKFEFGNPKTASQTMSAVSPR